MRNRREPRLARAALRLADIPGRPDLYLQVARMCGDPNTTVMKLAKEIRTDPAATVALLRLANSALYHRPKSIGTVTEAITIVGHEGVKAMLATVYLGALQRTLGGAGGFLLLRHGVASGVAARALASRDGGKDVAFPERAYVAGLLHDLGRFALSAPRSRGAEGGGSVEAMLAAERKRFGFTHAELGEAVAENWHLPAAVCAAIGEHHSPGTESPDPRLSAVVHLAGLAADSALAGGSRDPDIRALAAVGLSIPEWERWLESVPALLGEAEEWSRVGEMNLGEAEAEARRIPLSPRPEVHVHPRHPMPTAKMPVGM